MQALSSASSAIAKPVALKRATARRAHCVRAVPTASTEVSEELYEVTLEKPLPLKFCRGQDGGAYIRSVGPLADEGVFEVGDRIMQCSASFGTEVWDANSYGQVMYALKTRNGEVYLKLKKNYGDQTAISNVSDSAFMKERNSGNYEGATKELQMKNYIKSKELTEQRGDIFNEGLALFDKSEYQAALEKFEDVIGLEPINYMGDDFSRYTLEYRLSHYNVACCLARLEEVDASLIALQEAMESGFEAYDKIRSDPNLANTRKSERFNVLMDMYDEPIINAGAVKMFKSLFGK